MGSDLCSVSAPRPKAPKSDRYLVTESALRRGHLVRRPRIDGHSRAQRPRQTLEAGFGDMMVIAAVKRRHVQRHAGIHGEGLEPFLDQFSIELADLGAAELSLEHQKRPPRYVERDTGQRLVHR